MIVDLMSRKVLCLYFALILVLTFLNGCSETINSKIVIQFSSFSGEKQKEFQLNDGETELNLNGTISMTSGSAEICISGKDTNEILFLRKLSNKENGTISIDINDLKGNKALVLGLKAVDVKKFSLDLTSKQKLIRDKEKPTLPPVK